MTSTTGPEMTAPRRIGDPRVVEETGRRLAAELARRLAEDKPSAVACWEVADDAVLAHVVARELGVPVWYALEVEGIVALDRDLQGPAAMVLVLERLESPSDVAGLAGVVANSGGRVVAVAAASGTGSATGTDAEAAPLVRGTQT